MYSNFLVINKRNILSRKMLFPKKRLFAMHQYDKARLFTQTSIQC